MSGEYEGLGLSPELEARAEESARRNRARIAAEDENYAAVSANNLGLTGREAEDHKAKIVAARQQGREAVRKRCLAIFESPEGKARPSAATELALRWDLSADQAIAKLATMPVEDSEAEAEATARRILES
jgi:hypothetical protein